MITTFSSYIAASGRFQPHSTADATMAASKDSVSVIHDNISTVQAHLPSAAWTWADGDWRVDRSAACLSTSDAVDVDGGWLYCRQSLADAPVGLATLGSRRPAGRRRRWLRQRVCAIPGPWTLLATRSDRLRFASISIWHGEAALWAVAAVSGDTLVYNSTNAAWQPADNGTIPVRVIRCAGTRTVWAIGCDGQPYYRTTTKTTGDSTDLVKCGECDRC